MHFVNSAKMSSFKSLSPEVIEVELKCIHSGSLHMKLGIVFFIEIQLYKICLWKLLLHFWTRELDILYKN